MISNKICFFIYIYTHVSNMYIYTANFGCFILLYRPNVSLCSSHSLVPFHLTLNTLTRVSMMTMTISSYLCCLIRYSCFEHLQLIQSSFSFHKTYFCCCRSRLKSSLLSVNIMEIRREKSERKITRRGSHGYTEMKWKYT